MFDKSLQRAEVASRLSCIQISLIVGVDLCFDKRSNKRMAEFPGELHYLESHEWARVEEDGSVTVGISDHAQDELGDVVFVELPEIDSEVIAKQEAGVVESVKAASDIYAPVSGTVIAINDKLEEEPEIVNDSPYDDGWFFKISPTDLDELKSLLSAAEYKESCEDDAH
jgi:glycine cleavage system H protein